jgi:endonuclease/exonuclease/phosphatase family metal-dependent hydrolase
MPDMRLVLSTVLLTVCGVSACVSNPPLRANAGGAPCEPRSSGVAWFSAVAANERAASLRWCEGIGSPLVTPDAATTAAVLPLAVVSWNTHVGGGDITALADEVRSGRLTAARPRSMILLLQEVVRTGADVPRHPAHALEAAHQQPNWPGGRAPDLVESARALGLALFYAPSMRNGRPREDRGNAILSTARLSDLQAIELPLERQRRVVVAATVLVENAGRTVPVRVISSHFTNLVGHHVWLLSEPARVRQARALAQFVRGGGPTILGGDLNAWFGYFDGAYRELARVLPSARPADRRPTFGPMRLDHILYSLPPAWHVEVRRADSRYGSDHFPLVALVTASPR